MKKEYLSYDAVQMAAETSFIQWVKEGGGSIHEATWKAWLEAHPDMQAIASDARKIVDTQLALVHPISHDVDKQALWDRIDADTPQTHVGAKQKSLKLRPLYIGLSIAAAIALFLLIFPFSSQTELRTPHGEHLAFVLPDSSSIELNAVSTIQYKEKEFAKNREVFLKGEAFFQVEKGDDFVVNTRLGSVKVLGTSFNVFERESSFVVQCLTGKVRVSTSKGKGSVDLLPGETSTLTSSGELLKNQDAIPTLASWREYKFRYDKTPLLDVLEEIKRQFNVEIDIRTADLDLYYTGGFEGRELEKALQDVLWPLNLTFNITQNTVIITEE